MIELLHLAPATNATSEQIFFAMKQIIMYLRNSCGKAQLNHLIVLYTYWNDIENLDLRKVAPQEFVGENEKRLSIFKWFWFAGFLYTDIFNYEHVRCSGWILLRLLGFFSMDRTTPKWSSPLRISSVNVTTSAVSSRFGHIYRRNP